MNRTVEDFDNWTSWLMYKGGVGVKGDDSWESWWNEEQVCFFFYIFIVIFSCLSSCKNQADA